MAALEILKASPRISKLIEKGEISEIHEELESSVGHFRMQSMNQSLLALLVHGTITYQEAMRQSPDPEDLSLKLRRMFPSIEQRGGDMSPSTADFAEIMELQQFRRLYEEQEEKQRLKNAEFEEAMEDLRREIARRDQELRDRAEKITLEKQENERLRGDYQRLRDEAQGKIDKLMERIKELNQRLMTK